MTHAACLRRRLSFAGIVVDVVHDLDGGIRDTGAYQEMKWSVWEHLCQKYNLSNNCIKNYLLFSYFRQFLFLVAATGKWHLEFLFNPFQLQFLHCNLILALYHVSRSHSEKFGHKQAGFIKFLRLFKIATKFLLMKHYLKCLKISCKISWHFEC